MPLDVSKIEISLEEGERWRRTLHITVPWPLVETQQRAEAQKLAKTLPLAGFRRGKVPAAVALKRYPNVIEERVVSRIIDQAFTGAVNAQSLAPITPGEIGLVQYAAGSDLSFDISFETEPRIELARIGGFRVQRPATAPVPEGRVAEVLEQLRKQSPRRVPQESGHPSDGQQVSVRVQDRGAGSDEATPYTFVLGKGEANEDLEAAIRSLEVGETGDFTIRFPEGEEREVTQVTISLDGRSHLERPELDDVFVESATAFETLEALKDDIREQLGKEAEQRAQAALHREILEQIVAANPFEVPDSMVEHHVKRFLVARGEFTEEEEARIGEQMRPQVIEGLRHQLVIERVAASEQIGASPEEIDARVEALAADADISIREMYRRLGKSGQLRRIERAITEKKVFEYLEARSEITASA